MNTPLIISLPTTEANLLVWSQTLLVWVIVNYFNNDATGVKDSEHLAESWERLNRWRFCVLSRSFFASVIVAALPGLSLASLSGRLWLSGVAFFGCLATPLFRQQLATTRFGKKWLMEWELIANALFTGISALIVAASQIHVQSPAVQLPLSTASLTRLCFSIALYLFAIKAGTHLVRGLLEKVETQPHRTSDPHQIDIAEINRGRLIGNLERVLLASLVAIGNYEALAFLIAAKGLIRIKEFENRDFAEYFLVGTLGSVLVASGVGVLLRQVMSLSL